MNKAIKKNKEVRSLNAVDDDFEKMQLFKKMWERFGSIERKTRVVMGKGFIIFGDGYQFKFSKESIWVYIYDKGTVVGIAKLRNIRYVV